MKTKNILLKGALVISGLMLSLQTFAASIFGDGVNLLVKEVKSNWIGILIIYTVVFGAFNLKHFMGDNADSKKGVVALLLYFGGIFATIGLIKYLESNAGL